MCDPTATTGPSACGGTRASFAPQAGWQLVKVPWTSFVPAPTYGGGNETSLDPTTLTRFDFQVQQAAANASVGVTFDFCVLDLTFY